MMARCKACGKEISDTAEVCPQCGHKTRYGKGKEDKKQKEIIFYAGLAALVIGAVLFFPALVTLLANYDDWYFWNWSTEEANSVVQNVAIGAGLLAAGAVCTGLTRKGHGGNGQRNQSDKRD